MDKNRLINQLDLLEKFLNGKNSFKTKDEEMLYQRNLTSKILSLTEGIDKVYRDSLTKNINHVNALISMLHISLDAQVTLNVVKIIYEIVGKATASNKRAHVFVQHGVTRVLLQCILNESREPTPCEDYLLLLHQILFRVCQRDRKLPMKARLSQCLPIIGGLIRAQVSLVPHSRAAGGLVTINSTVGRNLTSLLQVLKLYSLNLINASRLGRHGIIPLLQRLIGFCGKNNLTLLKLVLGSYQLCVRTKSNASKAVNQGALQMLLENFLDWNRLDSKDRQMYIRKSILGVIKHLINLRAGKKSFLEADGLHILYGFCDNYKHHPSMENLVTLSSLILRKCFPRNRLPLVVYDSVLRCPLPYVWNRRRYINIEEHVDSNISLSNTSTSQKSNSSEMTTSCKGDSNRLEDASLESEDVKCNSSSIFTNQSNGINGNQFKSQMFRTLDKKVTQMSKKLEAKKLHQGYLSQINYEDSLEGKAAAAASATTNNGIKSKGDGGDVSRSGVIDNECNDSELQQEKMDESMVEQMLMPGSTYRPVDDRHLSELLTRYQWLFNEQELFSGTDSSYKKLCQKVDEKLSLNGGDKKVTTEQQIINKTQKKKEVLPVSVISVIINDAQSNEKIPKNNSRNLKRNNSTETIKTLESSKASSNTAVSSLSSSSSSNSTTTTIGVVKNKIATSDKPNETSKGTKPVTKEGQVKLISGKRKEDSEKTDSQDLPLFTDCYITTSILITRSLGQFTLIGYPDLFAESCQFEDFEPLSESFQQKVKRDVGVTKRRALSATKKSLSRNNNGQKSNIVNSQQRPSSANSNSEYLAQNKILDDLRRVIDNEDVIDKIVFDLDKIVYDMGEAFNLCNSEHSNSDELEIEKNSKSKVRPQNLEFESRFESGNLRKVIQIRQYEYDLMLSPDININHHIQWFYFRISGMESYIPYRFNIINCEKPNSQFNFGMQPLLFSVKESMLGRNSWRRWGTEVCYYKNHFARSAATCGGAVGKSYFTCTFMIEFPHSGDVCYLAYHYPYTYTRLLTDINIWTRQFDTDAGTESRQPTTDISYCTAPKSKVLFSVQEMCTSLLGNPVPLITITNRNLDNVTVQSAKKYIFLTGRVHPGESNSSWVMKGCIDYLLSDTTIANRLRDIYIFKIIPMLNPDGVINGCHRCSMSAQDLNRRWLDPCEMLNPTIYHTKGLLMLLSKIGQTPQVYCDFHGHSRRKNVFMFGCSALQSWLTEDLNNPAYIEPKVEDQCYVDLPTSLNEIASAFSIDCCSFYVDKVKESTGRVVVWRQFGVKRSYTMESTYCGCDQGVYRNQHINVNMLKETGARFAEALILINQSESVMYRQSAALNSGAKSNQESPQVIVSVGLLKERGDDNLPKSEEEDYEEEYDEEYDDEDIVDVDELEDVDMDDDGDDEDANEVEEQFNSGNEGGRRNFEDSD